MAQEVKIPVSADTGAAESGIRRLERSAEGVARGFKDAAAQAANLDDKLRRVKTTQGLLSKEFKRPISENDAEAFLGRFDKMRAGRGAGASRMRAFDDFDGWYGGHRGMFGRQGAADAHRRFVMSAGMQGTDYVNQFGGPSSDGEGGGGRGGGSGVGGWGKALGMAKGFALGGLALAGIGSISGMAGKAVSSATTELEGYDVLKRQMGDLGVSFEQLKFQSRQASEGLGLTYVEAMRAAIGYQSAAGNLGPADVKSGRFGSQLRNAEMMHVAFGIDTGQAVGAWGTLERVGGFGGKDDPTGDKLAGRIAMAFEKSGYPGQASEVLSAISNYSETIARASLTRPNIEGYAGLLTSMMGRGRIPGMDPAGAAAAIGTADANFRHGGAFGEASKMFNFMALASASPGMDPFAAKALEQGGLLATTRSTFGAGAPLARLFHGRLDDVTNLEKIQKFGRRFNGTDGVGVETFGNNMGLDMPTANALMFARTDQLPAIAKDIKDRADADNPGMAIRKSSSDLESKLTELGEQLVKPLEAIQRAVVAVANKLAPDLYADPVADSNLATSEVKMGNAGAYMTKQRADNGRGLSMLGRDMRSDTQALVQQALGGQPLNLDAIVPNHGKGSAELQARWERLQRLSSEFSTLDRYDTLVGATPHHGIRQINTESHFDGTVPSSAGALGIAQIMPGTAKLYAKRFGELYGHAYDPSKDWDSIHMYELIMGDNMRAAHGDVTKADRMYDSGSLKGDGPETADYVAKIDGVGTPMPPGKSVAGGPGGSQPTIVIAHTVEGRMLDIAGKHVGSVVIKPVVQPVPAGGN